MNHSSSVYMSFHLSAPWDRNWSDAIIRGRKQWSIVLGNPAKGTVTRERTSTCKEKGPRTWKRAWVQRKTWPKNMEIESELSLKNCGKWIGWVLRSSSTISFFVPTLCVRQIHSMILVLKSLYNHSGLTYLQWHSYVLDTWTGLDVLPTCNWFESFFFPSGKALIW